MKKDDNLGDPPNTLYSSALIMDRLASKKLDGFTLSEQNPLPRDVCCGGQEAVDFIDFDAVWDRYRAMSGMHPCSAVKVPDGGKLEVSVGSRLVLILSTYFEGEPPDRTLRIDVEQRKAIT